MWFQNRRAKWRKLSSAKQKMIQRNAQIRSRELPTMEPSTVWHPPTELREKEQVMRYHYTAMEREKSLSLLPHYRNSLPKKSRYMVPGYARHHKDHDICENENHHGNKSPLPNKPSEHDRSRSPSPSSHNKRENFPKLSHDQREHPFHWYNNHRSHYTAPPEMFAERSSLALIHSLKYAHHAMPMPCPCRSCYMRSVEMMYNNQERMLKKASRIDEFLPPRSTSPPMECLKNERKSCSPASSIPSTAENKSDVKIEEEAEGNKK